MNKDKIKKHATAIIIAMSVDSWWLGRSQTYRDNLVQKHIEAGATKLEAFRLAKIEAAKNLALVTRDAFAKGARLTTITEKLSNEREKWNKFKLILKQKNPFELQRKISLNQH
jgi:hypothetical protein